jgi:hypothetical protein
LHLYGFSPEWILECFFKLPFCEKSIGHWLHLYGISPVWILKCFLKCLVFEKSSGYWLVGYNIGFIWKHILYLVHNSIKVYDKQISLLVLLHLQQNW